MGSVLLGSQKHIAKALRIRKLFGGAMRQAGYMAAAGIYALDHHVKRLALDHQKARAIGKGLQKCRFVKKVASIETNIIIFYLHKGILEAELIEKLKEKGVLLSTMGEGKLRMVTHLEITEKQVEQIVKILKDL